jgi:hypothetical protein
MKIAALLLLTVPLLPTALRADERPRFVFCCQPENDLYRVLGGEKSGFPRLATPSDAVQAAGEGDGVLLLADGYPDKSTVVAPEVFDAAAKKKLRLYVEYPATLPDVEIGPPQAIKLERGVITSNAFGDSLPPMRIVMVNGCRYVPAKLPATTNSAPPTKDVHFVLARVAGVDTAVFGLADTPSEPLLFDHPRGNLLVATTKLSHFITGRYMPQDAWRTIWRTILGRLQPGASIPAIDWTPTVRPAYGRDEPLSADAELQALHRSADWITASRILRHPQWPQEVQDRSLHYNTVRDMPPADWPLGDGSFGILEGYSSTIRADGSQPMRYAVRDDNMSEVAMLLTLDAATRDQPRHRAIAANLLDYIQTTSGLTAGNCADPAKPEYGLIRWSLDLPNSYWSDDHGRALLSMMAVSASLKAAAKNAKANDAPTPSSDFSRWDDLITRCILADFRTTGVYGYREDCVFAEKLQANGWQYYFNGKYVKYSPHYEAWLWPCYLWAYKKTGFEPLFARTETGARMLMEAYPARWEWCNRSGSIERARALLPLAWLVRVQDTPEHRQWLRTIARDLIALQDSSGAIRETIGGDKPGTAANAEYGTCETSLIQTDGDPIADMLYTCNFALIGLHEAAAATGEPLYAEAEDKLAKFLCRIQVRSTAHPELDGAWYRAFNFRNWEYWASNADWEWGPWCTEAGWTQPWIAGTLALRQMKTSLWDVAQQASVSKNFDQIRRQMLPDEVLNAGIEKK